jgi:hypothetical protein
MRRERRSGDEKKFSTLAVAAALLLLFLPGVVEPASASPSPALITNLSTSHSLFVDSTCMVSGVLYVGYVDNGNLYYSWSKDGGVSWNRVAVAGIGSNPASAYCDLGSAYVLAYFAPCCQSSPQQQYGVYAAYAAPGPVAVSLVSVVTPPAAPVSLQFSIVSAGGGTLLPVWSEYALGPGHWLYAGSTLVTSNGVSSGFSFSVAASGGNVYLLYTGSSQYGSGGFGSSCTTVCMAKLAGGTWSLSSSSLPYSFMQAYMAPASNGTIYIVDQTFGGSNYQVNYFKYSMLTDTFCGSCYRAVTAATSTQWNIVNAAVDSNTYLPRWFSTSGTSVVYGYPFNETGTPHTLYNGGYTIDYAAVYRKLNVNTLGFSYLSAFSETSTSPQQLFWAGATSSSAPQQVVVTTVTKYVTINLPAATNTVVAGVNQFSVYATILWVLAFIITAEWLLHRKTHGSAPEIMYVLVFIAVVIAAGLLAFPLWISIVASLLALMGMVWSGGVSNTA